MPNHGIGPLISLYHYAYYGTVGLSKNQMHTWLPCLKASLPCKSQAWEGHHPILLTNKEDDLEEEQGLKDMNRFTRYWDIE